jgi:DNA transformation protein
VPQKSEIATLRNLGEKSERRLNGIGIYTRADLERVGAVGAYCLMKDQGFAPSLNLVYAIQGAIMDLHWTDLPLMLKHQLKQEVEDHG